MRTFLKIFFLFSVVAATASSCGSSMTQEEMAAEKLAREKDSVRNLLKQLDSVLIANRKAEKTDVKTANETVKAQLTYAAKFPQEKDAAKYMFKASDIAINELHQPALSAKILYDLTQKYPDFKEMSVCYFQLGMLHDNYLNDTAKARLYYKTFLEKYPNDELAEQVKTLLSMVGKSFEEITNQKQGK